MIIDRGRNDVSVIVRVGYTLDDVWLVTRGRVDVSTLAVSGPVSPW